MLKKREALIAVLALVLALAVIMLSSSCVSSGADKQALAASPGSGLITSMGSFKMELLSDGKAQVYKLVDSETSQVCYIFNMRGAGAISCPPMTAPR